MTPDNSTEKQKDKALGSRVLQAWYGTFKNVKLYKADHPSSHETAKKFAQMMNAEIFRDKLELSIHNLDGLFIIGESYYIEESLAQYDLLHSLEDHNIPTVAFSQGLGEDEVLALCDYLSKRRLPGMGDSGFVANHIRAVVKTKEAREAELKRQQKSKYRGNEAYVRIRELYDELIAVAELTFSKLIEEQSVTLLELSEPMEKLLDELHQNPSAFSTVLANIPITNLHIQHSVHTMIFSLFLGQQVSIDSSNLKTLGLSALLHDMGRLFLPADFTTGYRILKEDIDFIQLHVRDGASYLAGVPGLPMNVVRVALEHHIGFDRQGYPQLPGFQKPHFFSQIVGLADFASWGTVSERFYHKPVALHRLVRSMMSRAGTQFDPLLVKVFIPFFGLFPPRTRVRLSTGETAEVIEPNTRNILRPLVALEGGGRFYLNTLSERSNGPAYEKSITKVLGRAALAEVGVPSDISGSES